jgi:hypothetical protein
VAASAQNVKIQSHNVHARVMYAINQDQNVVVNQNLKRLNLVELREANLNVAQAK